MSVLEDNYTTLVRVVSDVARTMTRRYALYGFGNADFQQECWVWLSGHQEKVAHYLAQEHGTRAVMRSLSNHCQRAGEDHKAHHLGYHSEDLVYYSKAQLRELLPIVYRRDLWAWPEKGEAPEVRAPSDPALGNEYLATLTDVDAALSRLGVDDQLLLAAFHDEGLTNVLMAEMHGLSEQVMSYRHDRAVGRLLRELGGPRPRREDDDGGHWGAGRHAQTNAAARAQQEKYWSEQ